MMRIPLIYADFADSDRGMNRRINEDELKRGFRGFRS